MTRPVGPLLDAAIRQADRLVTVAQALAIALEDLPGLELPPSTGASMDQAQVRAIAVLYLASELEAAGVIPTAEDLVRLARSGALQADLGGATPLLESFWLKRQERPTSAEREGCFATVFGVAASPSSAGTAPNDDFEDLLINLCEALYKLDEQATNTSWGGVAQQARTRTAALALLDNLSSHAGGLTAFLAKEILDALKESLAILNHAGVLAAFGSRTIRDVIAAIDRQLRRSTPRSYDVHARRGQSGMTILSWLSDAAPLLASNVQPLVGIDHPVIPAAVDWLEASLSLTETTGTSQTPAPGPTSPTIADRRAASWDTLAG